MDRLPEAFSGYNRSYSSFPIPYPTACSPQAWATATPLLLVRSMLGLTPAARKIILNPSLSEEIGRIAIKELQALGAGWDIEAMGRKGYVRLAR